VQPHVDPEYDRWLAHQYCAYLERIFRIRVFNWSSERMIVNVFLRIQSLDDLKKLCDGISNYLINRLGYNDMFLV